MSVSLLRIWQALLCLALLSSSDLFARTMSLQARCESALRKVPKTVQIQAPDEMTATGFLGMIGTIIATDENDLEIGRLSYGIRTDAPDNLYISDLYVFEENRRQGIATALYAKVLLMHPEIMTIESRSLYDLNEEKILEHRANGKNRLQALQLSPAGQIRKRLGFTRSLFTHCDSRMGIYEWIVGRREPKSSEPPTSGIQNANIERF